MPARIITLFVVAILFATGIFGQSITCQTTTDWGTGFSAQVTINNPSDAPLNDWTVQFDVGRHIDSIWNARIAKVDGSQYSVSGLDWDLAVPAKSSITFGFNGSPGNLTCDSASFQFTAAASGPPPSISPETGAVEVTITQTARWQGGFAANLMIANKGSAPLDAWKLTFAFDQIITSFWNGSFQQQGAGYVATGDASTASIPAGGTVIIGFTGQGALTANSSDACTLNASPCHLTTVPVGTAAPAASAIAIEGIDKATPATQMTVPLGQSNYTLKVANGVSGNFSVTSNSPQIATVRMVGSDSLFITGVSPGRASLRIEDTVSKSTRFIGVRVQNADGTAPGMPKSLALGSVSEDTFDALTYWESSQRLGRLADIRYIYLNGGPKTGWDTWSDEPAGRASGYIRNSRKMGLIPFFVFYNIPDGSEGYTLDLAHVQDAAYLSAYFPNLKLALDAINQESPEDVVGMILEPDFLGYLAQNDPRLPSAIPAMTHAIYDSGVLDRATDPLFPDTVEGLVSAVNYTISKLTPQVAFGWQMNLWASPAGGWTTPVPGKGLIHKTDDAGIAGGRKLIYNEAAAITNYYLRAGVARYGAAFLSIDKYGLDATGFEQRAAADPASSTWFWSHDLWENYLTFVRAMRDTSALPVVLWQLPAGHINSSTEFNPLSADGRFPDLTGAVASYEDSAPTFFLGDTFQTTGARATYFSVDNLNTQAVSTDSNGAITWKPGVTDAAAAGVAVMLFGPGVGASTTNIGSPPSDGFWWTIKALKYLQNPVPAGSGKPQ